MRLRMIPTQVHGVLDYLTGSTLLAAPGLLRVKDVPQAALTLRLAGGGAVIYSLMTDYGLGLVRLLPMRVHLALDAMSGVLLASSPWLFGFSERNALLAAARARGGDRDARRRDEQNRVVNKVRRCSTAWLCRVESKKCGRSKRVRGGEDAA